MEKYFPRFDFIKFFAWVDSDVYFGWKPNRKIFFKTAYFKLWFNTIFPIISNNIFEKRFV